MNSNIIQEIELKDGSSIKISADGQIILPSAEINYLKAIEYISAIQKAIEKIREYEIPKL